MNDLAIPSSDDHAEAYLDRAIVAVLALPVPGGALKHCVETAALWESTSGVSLPRRNYRWVLALVAAGIALSLLVAGILFFGSGPESPAGPGIAQNKDQKETKTQAPQGFHEPVSMTNPVMAASAPIIACIGPEKPIQLGAVVPHADINKGLDSNVVRLHVWDWSKSNLSRVLLMQRSELGVLSPDGTTMLTSEGETINLQSHQMHQYAGFQVNEGERMSSVQFAPSQKYVAAMIHVRTQIDPVPGNPQLSGATHFWSLRLLDMKAEKRIGEYPADAHAGVAFSPDEASLVYSSEKHVISRRDLASGKLLNEYQPAVGIHGAVGITISPDGRFVAAAQYHGKLYIWNMQTDKLIVEHQFVRENGEQDTFFQAKVMRFSPDGERLAMASGNRLKVMETQTGKVIKHHQHETTPVFAHLQWSQDAKQIALVTYSEPTEYAGKDRFPPRPTADVFPRVYEWDWQAGDPRPKQFP